MFFDQILSHRGEWLEGCGYLSKVVISSRIRLARNLENIPFPHQANKKELNKVSTLISQIATKSKYLKNANIIKLQDISDLERQILVERHLISREHTETSAEKLAIISAEEIISIMVNEEDHFRLQSLQSGLQILEAWRLIDKIDTEIEKEAKYAFSSQWGYLTACPTNTGTGLRSSVMVHLLGLIMSKKLNKILQNLTQFRFMVRGLYGEGTDAIGGFFQISNAYSLGQSEESIINNLEGVVKQLVEQEQQAREFLLEKSRSKIEDMIWRAHGILKNARIISSNETLELLSAVRLGIHLEIIKNIGITELNEMLILTQPAHLQKLAGVEQKPNERDITRADFIRGKLENK